MKPKEPIIGLAFVLSIIVFLLIFGDFMALHDINKDYVSNEVLEYLQVDTSKELPEWTKQKMEWTFIEISLFLKSVFMIVVIVAIAKTIRKLKL